GISGYRCLVSSEMSFAASPTISTSFVTPSRRSSSFFRSSRLRPSVKAMAFRAASTRWRSLTSSGGGIEGQRGGLDFVAEVAAQIVVGAKVDLMSPEQRRQSLLHAGDGE